MRGTLDYIYPDRPMDTMQLSVPPEFEKISVDVGGLVQIVQGWDQHYTFDGKLVPAIVMCNEEPFNLPFNFWATAGWQAILGSKGVRLIRPLNTFRLHGTIIIATGDVDFVDAILG